MHDVNHKVQLLAGLDEIVGKIEDLRSVTASLLELARAGDFDGLIELSASRRELIDSLVNVEWDELAGADFPEKEASVERLRSIADDLFRLESDLVSLLSEEMSTVARKVNDLRLVRRALSAYRAGLPGTVFARVIDLRD